MDNTHFYETIVTWTEGRKGILSEPTLHDIEVATPPQFTKGVPNIWSPEHLFVASVNICLMTTFLAIAENSKLEFASFTSKAKGKLEKVENGFMITGIELFPEINVIAEKDLERAERIVQKAEQHCLISNSIKSEIKLFPKINLNI
ncbi:MAG: OsmC family protein [Ignavibacteriae bacterium]|nr:OsmC family protein [Ignavibacteriota bacterium]